MSIHLAKGVKLALALLVPVISTVFLNWRTAVTARRLDTAQSGAPR
ncbi:MAG: hypothetical protein ACR2GG_04375 [Gemmatimonadaceae bacterium]